jgi:hypothetical protein
MRWCPRKAYITYLPRRYPTRAIPHEPRLVVVVARSRLGLHDRHAACLWDSGLVGRLAVVGRLVVDGVFADEVQKAGCLRDARVI